MGIIDRLTKKNETTKKTAAPKARPVKAAPKTEAAKETTVPVVSSVKGNAMGSVLVKAHMSEKAAIGEVAGRYTFLVTHDATKLSIKTAVQQMYGVRPIAVRIVNTEGKRLRFGRSFGKRSDMKKAIVTLPKGKSISIHEGV